MVPDPKRFHEFFIEARRRMFATPQLGYPLRRSWGACRKDRHVLITGPYGVEFDEFARLIHDFSPRRQGPFITCDCEHSSDEKEMKRVLFGVAKELSHNGRPVRGRLHEAQKGTLYLRDFATAPVSIQVALENVVRWKRTPEIGDRDIDSRPLDVQIIGSYWEPGNFLRRRIAILGIVQSLGWVIQIPGLKDRKLDALALFLHAMKCRGTDLQFIQLTALAAILHHSWPQNLKDVIRLADQISVEPPDTTLHYSFIEHANQVIAPAESMRLKVPALTVGEFLASTPGSDKWVHGFLNDETRAKQLVQADGQVTIDVQQIRFLPLEDAELIESGPFARRSADAEGFATADTRQSAGVAPSRSGMYRAIGKRNWHIYDEVVALHQYKGRGSMDDVCKMVGQVWGGLSARTIRNIYREMRKVTPRPSAPPATPRAKILEKYSISVTSYPQSTA